MVVTKVKNKNKKHNKKHSKKFAKNRKNKSMKKNMKGGGNTESLGRVKQMVQAIKNQGRNIAGKINATTSYGTILRKINTSKIKSLLPGKITNFKLEDGTPLPESFKKLFKKEKTKGPSSNQTAAELLAKFKQSQSGVAPSSPPTQMVHVSRNVALEALAAREKLRVSGLQGQVEERQKLVSTPSLFGTPSVQSVPQLVSRFRAPMMTPSASASALKMTSTSSSAPSFKLPKQFKL